MSTKTKVIVLTIVLALIAFATGRQIWPPDPMMPVPTAGQLPFFLVLGLFESVAFGLGVSFLVFGWPAVKKVSGKNDTLTKLAFLSIAWYLINWWPHDNLHQHVGMNLNGLLMVEYGFHVTMIIAGSILAYFFITRVLKEKIG
ncbi:MAG TPA: hypothetical protein VG965_06835 [Patescibacteria group bacterium]|nr:hypothetical protein [Patescibacteria group bacterium]